MYMRKLKLYIGVMFVLIIRKPEFSFCGGGFWDMMVALAWICCSPVRGVPCWMCRRGLDLGDAGLEADDLR
jgi:hypothetical protein